MLVEDDARGVLKSNEKLLDSFSDSYRDLYKFGDFLESHITDVDTYLLSKVDKSYNNLPFKNLPSLPKIIR